MPYQSFTTKIERLERLESRDGKVTAHGPAWTQTRGPVCEAAQAGPRRGSCPEHVHNRPAEQQAVLLPSSALVMNSNEAPPK